MRDTVNILGVNIDRSGMDEAVERAISFLNEGRPHSIYTPNPEMIMHAFRHKGFMEVLNRADMVVPDGIGVVYASRLLKKPVKERVAGFDLSLQLIEYAAKNRIPIFIYGGREGVAEEAAKNLKEKFNGLVVAGVSHGYVKDADSVVNDINNSGAKLVLVCMGAPRQEEWIDKNKDKATASLFIGAGGSVDVFAGKVRRAPKIFIRLNLEWLYRLLTQPSRFVRMLDLPVFAFRVLTCKK